MRARLFLLAALMAGFGGLADGARMPEFIEVGGIPLKWEDGYPYFTRFTKTDHDIVELAGVWKFRADPEDVGESEEWFSESADASAWLDHRVPGSWNHEIEGMLDYQGAGWYRRIFHAPESMMGRFNRLVFDGVAYGADVYLNGCKVGSHHGGFSRWSLDVSRKLKYGGDNLLVVKVDNRRDYRNLPALKWENANLGWWYYGGINRLAIIESGPFTTLCKLSADTDHLGRLEVAGVVYFSPWADERPEGSTVHARLYDLDGALVADLGRKPLGDDTLKPFQYSTRVDGVKAWSPETPENRYLLELEVAAGKESERQGVEIGFREFEFRGSRAYLNDRPVFLRGVNRHEDYPESGPVLNEKRIEEDMSLLHELRVNFMRPAHYPNDPRWLDACDREGIMIMHEIPLYQIAGSPKSWLATVDGGLEHSARNALARMIERDRNHPSVVMWSVGNENQTYMFSVRKLHQNLYELAKRLDPEREVSFAIFTNQVITPSLEITAGIADAIFINEYWGWYYGEMEKVGGSLDKVHKKWPDLPIVVAEFGAGALYGKHDDRVYPVGATVDHDFTEEYQAEFYDTQLEIILAKPYVTGTMPWIFADFRDGNRGQNPRVDFNLKGLVSYERERKQSFFVIERYYGKLAAEAR